MPKLQRVIRSIKGVYAHQNPLGEVPDGALIKAQDCVFNREGVPDRRRGFNKYNVSGLTAVTQIMDYKNRLHIHDGTAVLYDDGAGTFTGWPGGAWAAPDATNRMRGVESRSTFFITSDLGIYRQESLTGTPRLAGFQKALDIELLDMANSSTGWMLPNTQIAYKILWKRTDVNDFLIVGAPSERFIVTNPITSVIIDWSAGRATVTHTAHGYVTGDTVIVSAAGEALYDGTHVITVFNANTYSYELLAEPTDKTDVAASAGEPVTPQIQWTIPSNIIAGDQGEIYRTLQSSAASTDPGDQLFRVIDFTATAAQITAGLAGHIDTLAEADLDLELYTNATRETASKENSYPPFSLDMAPFKGHIFFSNTRQRHQATIRFVSAAALSTGQVLDILNNDPAIGSYAISVGSVENISTDTALLSTAESTDALNTRKTVESIIRVINRSTTSTDVYYAEYASGANDPPGKIRIYKRLFQSNTFDLRAGSAQTSADYDPPISGTSGLVSTNDAKVNRLYHSKFEQPDAVPVLNFDDIGSEESPIRRILALRDSLIIMKEEGVWRLSGESESSFDIRQLDPTTKLIAPETAVVLNNNVYAVTTQGVVKISEFGTTIVSRNIEKEFSRIMTFSVFAAQAHAVAYESERQYILFTPEISTDTTPTIAWVYNYLTKEWVYPWKKSVRSALVLFDNDKLYLSLGGTLSEERKTYDSSQDDYRDEDVSITIDSTSTATDEDGNTVTTATFDWTETAALAEGFYLFQGANTANIRSVVDNGGDNFTVTLDAELPGLTTGAATVSLGYTSAIQLAPEAGGNQGVSKQFPVVQIYTENESTSRLKYGFVSNTNPNTSFRTTSKRSSVGSGGINLWGLNPWSDSSFGAAPPFRIVVPRQFQRCQALTLLMSVQECRENFPLLGVAFSFRQYGDRTVLTPR